RRCNASCFSSSSVSFPLTTHDFFALNVTLKSVVDILPSIVHSHRLHFFSNLGGAMVTFPGEALWSQATDASYFLGPSTRVRLSHFRLPDVTPPCSSKP